MLSSVKVCGLCKNIHFYQSDNTFICNNLSNIPIPVYSESFINEVNSKLLSGNCISDSKKCKAKYYLGIIKFKYKNKIYIHCPIQSVNPINGEIEFGVCPNFEPIENNVKNRQRLSSHKFRYHYNSDKDFSSSLKLKVSKSIEEVVLDFNNIN
jgi:hypothetical protein